MRVTTAMQFQRFLGSLRAIRERMADDGARLASGRRIEKPSDDPTGAAEAIVQCARVESLDRYSANAASAQGYLNSTESALGSVSNLLTQARAAATRGASDTSASVRMDLANEVDSVREQILALARTTYRDRFVFSGTSTSTDPYTDAGIYQGNDGAIRVEIGDSETTELNLTGARAFGSGTGVLGVLDQLAAALRANDTTAIRAALPAVEAGRSAVSDARSEVGTRIARLDAVTNRLGDVRVAILGRIAHLENADAAELITRLASDTTAEGVTLAVGARIGTRSLFDYLG